MATLPKLRDLYKSCVGNYIRATEVFDDDITGKIDRIALDGMNLVLWAQLVGLHNAQLDPALTRFQHYLFDELRQLQQSLEKTLKEHVSRVSTDTLRANHLSWATTSKSHVLSHWIRDGLMDSGEITATIPKSTGLTKKGISEPSERSLCELAAISKAIRNSLLRLLSVSQKPTLERAIQDWETKILLGNDLTALEALKRATTDVGYSMSSLASEVPLRIQSIQEDVKIDVRLLRRLEIRSEELQWSIARDQEPEITRTLSPSHAIGKFSGRTVFIEKRRNVGWTAEGAKAIEIFLRIDSLASRLAMKPKPSSFCVPDLLGYYSDRQDKEYGFVYAWPWEIGSLWEEKFNPKTLNECISEGESDSFVIGPSLTKRFKIALKLAICVRAFHLFGWLHKSINSHNVLFFPRQVDGEFFNINEDRLVLTGFEYSRQDGLNPVTEPVTKLGDYDIYRHPDVTAFERRSSLGVETGLFEKKHDLYALGLLLVEIGLWNTLEAIQREFYQQPTAEQESTSESGNVQRVPTPHEFLAWVVKSGKGSLEELLRFSTGERYADATMACLRGTVATGDTYFPQFYAKVIESLSYCTV